MADAGLQLSRVDDAALTQALQDLAPHVAFPPTPDLASAVTRRLAGQPRRAPSALGELWPVRLPIRRSAVLAIALLLLLVGAAIGIGLGLSALRIVPVSSLPPTATPAATTPGGPPGSGLGLGDITTLAAARSAVQFAVRIPSSAGLAVPDAVYVGHPPTGGRVELVYAVRPGLPQAGPTPVGLLITQLQGNTDEGMVKKMVHGSSIEFVSVNGARAYWIAGEPHVLLYEPPGSATVEEEPGRLVGNTLIWETGGVIYRIESGLSRDEVIAIAQSMR